jgi:two-component system, NarL family, sensor histidine kinase UhpB
VGLADMAAACRVKVQDYFFSEDQRFITEEFFPRVLREGHGEVEIRLRHFQTGEPIWMFYYLFSVRDASGTPVGWATVSRDITERKRAEAALRESEARLRLSAEAANVGLWDWDLQTNKVFYSPEWKRQIGYRDDEIANDFSEWQRRVHPDDLAPMQAKVQAFLANPVGRHETEFRFRHKDGSYRWIYTHADVLRDAAGKPTRMLGCHIDITERKQAEEAMHALAAHLQTVREEERTGIARELHDQLGQALTGLKLDLGWLGRHGGDAGKLAEMTARINDTIQLVRRLCSELRPGILDDLGLAAAVEWQAEEFQKRAGIACTVTATATGSLSREATTAVFRILQETLTNVARHARATKVAVTLAQAGNELVLEVRDNGRGITPAEATGTKSLGLLGIRERAAAVGGRVEFVGEPGKGTTVTVRIPVGSRGAEEQRREGD